MDRLKRFFCSKDCPDACYMLAEAKEDGLKVKPLSESFLDKEFVCGKLKKFYEREIITNRATSLFNHDPVETEEAIEQLAHIIKTAKRVLFYRGSGSLSYYMGYWDKLLSHFNNIWFVEGSPCDETGIRAHIEDFGVCMNPPVENLERTKNIILFGKNALVTSPHLFAYLSKLKKEGKKLIYIDPIKSETTVIADRFIQIKPASDGLLAHLLLSELGFVEPLDEKTTLLKAIGIKESELEYLKEHIVEAETGIIEGIGLQRYSNGKNAISWINRLAYYTSNLDFLYYSRPSKHGIYPPVKAEKRNKISISEISKALSENLFDAAIIVAANPIVTFCENDIWEESLKKITSVAIDTNLSETASCCKLFIRSGGMFAQEDIQGSYFFNKTHKRERLLEHMTSDKDLIEMLSKRLSVTLNIPSLDELSISNDSKMRIFSNKKINLSYPAKGEGLRLITLSHKRYLNSQTEKVDIEEIYLSPEMADKWKIKDGEIHRFSSERATEAFLCRISSNVKGDTAFAYKNRSKTVNRLTKSLATDAKHAFSYYDCFITKKGD